MSGTEFYSPYFRRFRFVGRLLRKRFRVPDGKDIPQPCVFVCRHKNMQGPINTLLWLDIPVHLWAISMFFEKETAFHQFYTYTYTARLHWPKPIAFCMAKLTAWWYPAFLRSMQAIPVYRKDARVIKTYRKSLEVLRKGESILLFPDIDYTDASDNIGEIYDGFLLLGKMYQKEAGKPLPIVPLYVDEKRHSITMGDAITLSSMDDFNMDKKETAARLKEALQRLADQAKE